MHRWSLNRAAGGPGGRLQLTIQRYCPLPKFTAMSVPLPSVKIPSNSLIARAPRVQRTARAKAAARARRHAAHCGAHDCLNGAILCSGGLDGAAALTPGQNGNVDTASGISERGRA